MNGGGVLGGLVPSLDQPLLRVPAERLSVTTVQANRRVEKELAAILDECKLLGEHGAIGAEQAHGQLGELVRRLHGLKRKIEEGRTEQAEHEQRCRARLDYLGLCESGTVLQGDVLMEHAVEVSALESADLPVQTSRTARLVCEYLFRAGFNQTAEALVAAAGIAGLVDANMHAQAREIGTALLRGECSTALVWVSEHRARLRRHHSGLEFGLRQQEFIELVRRAERPAAIAYARAHFPAHAKSQMQQIQRAMATTAFPHAETAATAYPALFADSAWAGLQQQFLREHRLLHCASEQPRLLVGLSAGLAALRNPACTASDDDEDDADADATPPTRGGADPCPACSSREMRALGARLPYAHHTRSSLICALTGARMHENNPPYALPNGRLVSASALEQLPSSLGVSSSELSLVVDPRTGECFRRSEVRKVYILS
mmetsp:Transcript_22811/g.57887  ORF Transcript_22811/g.57887 Transcript_22811/m.57887 type:complete len:433 (+) Transcript_22811:172-1470(+)